MKIKSVHLKSFKKFGDRLWDFTNSETGLAKNLILLVGMNGSGKSTILQAIAATLGAATGRLPTAADLNWPGFNLELAGNSWSGPTDIKIEVEFSPAEVAATQEFYHQLREVKNLPVAPSDKNYVTLNLQVEGKQSRVQANSEAELCQFQGREYAKQILKRHGEGYKIFERVGTVFWYTEQRTTTSLTPAEDNGKSIAYNDDRLRRHLSNSMLFHQQLERGQRQLESWQRDRFAEIERVYQAVFPRHSFSGPVPRPDIDEVLSEPWFYLSDGHKEYEISEMSGGERAIFPVLFDLTNWNINNSVVLIDEIELHLHPPIQQTLLRALPSLGKNNQFIITTHSDAVAQIVPNKSIVRVEG